MKLAETGRSMVEMLAVLAVIGVLSVTGSFGFKFAMARNKANTLMYEANKRAHALSLQFLMQGKTEGTLSEFSMDSTFPGGTFDDVNSVALDGAGQFKIKINDVPEDVCKLVKSFCDGNGVVYGFKPETCATNNAVVLTYNKDLSSDEPDFACVTVECAEGFSCIEGFCYGAMDEYMDEYSCESNDGEWVENDGYRPCGRNGSPTEIGTCTCESPYTGQHCELCESGYFMNSYGQCVSCSDEGHPLASKEECGKCGDQRISTPSGTKYRCALSSCPNGTFSRNGVCLSCYTEGRSRTSESECNKCSNREYWNGYCYYVTAQCVPDEFSNRNGICYSCETQSRVATTKAQCDLCENRTMAGDYCILDGDGCSNGFYDKDGQCISCTQTSAVSTTQNQCDRCSERTMDGDYCVLKSNKCNGFYGTDGNCYLCNNTNRINASATECGKCSNREYYRKDGSDYCINLDKCPSNQFSDLYGNCQSCSVNSAYIVSQKHCDRCGSTRTMLGEYCILASCDGFYDGYGNCYPCNSTDKVSASDTECAKCENRMMVKGFYSYNRYCVLDNCNGFYDDSANCRACNYNGTYVYASATECGKCSNREYMNGYCFRSDKCTGGTFSDYGGNCLSCTDTSGSSTTSTECNKCGSTRKMSGSYCVFNYSGFYDTSGTYRDCNYNGTYVNASATECGKCSNWEYMSGYCFRSDKCTGETFSDNYGNCHSCTVTSGYSTTSTECNKCGSTRKMSGSQCVLASCDGFYDSSGWCRACNYDGTVYASATECGKCSNWEYMSGHCFRSDKCTGETFSDNYGNCHSCTVTSGYSTTSTECNKCGSTRKMNGSYCVKA